MRCIRNIALITRFFRSIALSLNSWWSLAELGSAFLHLLRKWYEPKKMLRRCPRYRTFMPCGGGVIGSHCGVSTTCRKICVFGDLWGVSFNGHADRVAIVHSEPELEALELIEKRESIPVWNGVIIGSDVEFALYREEQKNYNCCFGANRLLADMRMKFSNPRQY